MNRNSATTSRNVVRRSASQMPTRTPADHARLDAAMHRPVDTADIPERTIGLNRVIRDSSGQLPRRLPSPTRDAILAELGRRGMTRYELWKAARKRCPVLPESTVYEFLRGQRQIGVAYVDALFLALDLVVAPAA
jgi:hypothetical protein